MGLGCIGSCLCSPLAAVGSGVSSPLCVLAGWVCNALGGGNCGRVPTWQAHPARSSSPSSEARAASPALPVHRPWLAPRREPGVCAQVGGEVMWDRCPGTSASDSPVRADVGSPFVCL